MVDMTTGARMAVMGGTLTYDGTAGDVSEAHGRHMSRTETGFEAYERRKAQMAAAKNDSVADDQPTRMQRPESWYLGGADFPKYAELTVGAVLFTLYRKGLECVFVIGGLDDVRIVHNIVVDDTDALLGRIQFKMHDFYSYSVDLEECLYRARELLRSHTEKPSKSTTSVCAVSIFEEWIHLLKTILRVI